MQVPSPFFRVKLPHAFGLTVALGHTALNANSTEVNWKFLD